MIKKGLYCFYPLLEKSTFGKSGAKSLFSQSYEASKFFIKVKAKHTYFYYHIW
jgi:hypothetical protein